MAGSEKQQKAAKRALVDSELEHLPPDMRWREWMNRVEAVVIAAPEPVAAKRWRMSWVGTAASIL